MRDLRFKVKGQTIEKDPNCDFSGIAKGTDNWLNLVFSFNYEWTGMARAVTMRSSDGVEVNRLINGKVAVPLEITQGEFFNISVYGKKENQLIATNKIFIDQV